VVVEAVVPLEERLEERRERARFLGVWLVLLLLLTGVC
jgi:hypothetical protein